MIKFENFKSRLSTFTNVNVKNTCELELKIFFLKIIIEIISKLEIKNIRLQYG